MKTFIYSTLFLGMISLGQIEARDLTYKFGAGYRQTTATEVRKNATRELIEHQLNGLELSYGIANDFMLSVYGGFTQNFHFIVTGPKLRYDLQKLISKDSAVWQYVNLFAEVAFLAKMGRESYAGITIHAPNLGVEILPFSGNNFAILSSAGVTYDFVKRNRIGFTKGMFGDVGVKYYF